MSLRQVVTDCGSSIFTSAKKMHLKTKAWKTNATQLQGISEFSYKIVKYTRKCLIVWVLFLSLPFMIIVGCTLICLCSLVACIANHMNPNKTFPHKSDQS